MFLDVLLRQHEHKKKKNTKNKKKLTVSFLAFPSVKFHKIWQIGNKYFTLVEARFPEKSIRPFLLQRRKTNLKKSKKNCLYKPYFFVFIIYIPLDAMCCENFGRFHRRKFKKITDK